MPATAERKFHLIAMGRAAVDLYGDQIGGRLEDMLTFNKSLGGSAANTAVGAARLGLNVAMLTRVGNEHMGRFVREKLADENVDVSHVATDPRRLTGLVILGIRDPQTFPHIFFRENCADMAIDPNDFDADFIGSSKSLLVNGTHFSTAEMDAACRRAVGYAKARGTKVIFDIDYRPVLWGLTAHGEGENRFIGADHISEHLQTIVPHCDLIVGTEEEVHIAGGTTDTRGALRKLRKLAKGATLVLKRGAKGCIVYTGEIPDKLEDGIVHLGFPTEVFNTLGAGDGFMGGFLSGWLRDLPLLECAKRANACGSLVVSRHGCSPAQPSTAELEEFLARSAEISRPHHDERIIHLHRTTTGFPIQPRIFVLAFDHRKQFFDLANGDISKIAKFKQLAADAVMSFAPDRCGVIVDDMYGRDAMFKMSGNGRWLARPVEEAGSRPLQFEAGHQLLAELHTWPAEHVIKCLVNYSVDDTVEMRAEQDEKLKILQDASYSSGRRLLLEVIPPEFATNPFSIVKAVEQLYRNGMRPVWWKLPPISDDSAWSAIAGLIQKYDPQCLGVVLLGIERPNDVLFAAFEAAIRSGVCIGFAIGRSVWREPAEQWFVGKMTDSEVVAELVKRYGAILNQWDKLDRARVA